MCYVLCFVLYQHFAHLVPEMRRMWASRFPKAVFADVSDPGLVWPRAPERVPSKLWCARIVRWRKYMALTSSNCSRSTPDAEPEPEWESGHCQWPATSKSDSDGRKRRHLWTVGHMCTSKLLYLGDRDGFIICSLILKHTDTAFFSYDPAVAVVREETAAVNRTLRGRYFCIEKAREAEVRASSAFLKIYKRRFD